MSGCGPALTAAFLTGATPEGAVPGQPCRCRRNDRRRPTSRPKVHRPQELRLPGRRRKNCRQGHAVFVVGRCDWFEVIPVRQHGGLAISSDIHKRTQTVAQDDLMAGPVTGQRVL